ncbi:hypothetical protein SAMN05444004_1143 [Jannaschia faecimaris]|uniref:Uncharacterized protein n=1 Tax=Jannaschia faecimaris TaxID=1244108 RepID=A0A1H3SX06_9RHOB|nr:hypothetical protein SAMN05444004_1143 [Jannaschia faecimaris]
MQIKLSPDDIETIAPMDQTPTMHLQIDPDHPMGHAGAINAF